MDWKKIASAYEFKIRKVSATLKVADDRIAERSYSIRVLEDYDGFIARANFRIVGREWLVCCGTDELAVTIELIRRCAELLAPYSYEVPLQLPALEWWDLRTF